MQKKKQKMDDTPVNIQITPEDMEDYAKGQYEMVDIFCDQIEKMGLSKAISFSGKDDIIKGLREINDEKMRRTYPDHLKKKEAERKSKDPAPNPDQLAIQDPDFLEID
jgi:CBS-domain-containing membrane protein